MALYFESWFLELFFVLLTSSLGVYVYFLFAYQFWKKKGIPFLEPLFPLGNLKEVLLLRRNLYEHYGWMYDQLKGHKFGGFYQLHRPTLLLRDPDTIKDILVRNFGHFHDRGTHSNEVSDPLTGNLFQMEGNKWKCLRQKLTSTFTSGKMKMMFPIVVECGEELKDYLAPFASREETIEIHDIMAKYTTDVISICAFGVKSNTLQNPDSEFRQMGRKMFQPTLRLVLGVFLFIMVPSLGDIINLKLFAPDVTEFFFRTVKEMVDYREKNEISRADFLQLLINIKNNKQDIEEIDNEVKDSLKSQKNKNFYDINGLSMNEIAAQAVAFFVAGFETSSSTISFCLYELALHPEIQDRLREELDSEFAKQGGKLTYEAILSMDYLDRVVSETLRKYPVLPFLMRVCTKEYQLPGSKVTLEPGTPVIVPIHAIQNDPQYYPNPEEFDPDRFTEEAKSQRHHYTYLPFGEGPRACIGLKFGIMQTKIGIASFMSGYEVNVCEKHTSIPLLMDRKTFVIVPKDGVKLKISNRR